MLPYASRVFPAPSEPDRTVAPRAERTGRAIWVGFALLGALLATYLIALIVRPADADWPIVDGWMVVGFEFIAGGLCIARAFVPGRGRTLPLVLGAALISWATGDFFLTAESWNGGNPPSPSLADAFYLGFYPLAYVALVIMLRRGLTRMVPATWLDGAVAGLGASAVCASFAFNTILKSVGGPPLAVATNLAYPIGDLLLLTLAVGGTALLSGRRNTPWLVVAVACGLNAVGDTFNLFNSSAGSTAVGTVFNAIAWPTAILLMSASVWLRREDSDPFATPRAPGFLLPGLGATAGLSILLTGTIRHVGGIALGLAVATLVVVGLRLTLSVRRLRAITDERHRESVTDELTGLGNRRRLFQILNAYFEDQVWRRDPQRRLAFLFVDLDHFKEINDSFGHAAGDELLKQLGPRLRATLRASDILVRLGGDELGVVLLDTDPHYATTVAQRLMVKLEEPFVLDAVSVRISASIGIAFAPTDAADSAGLLRCADLAMYRAKFKETSSFEVYQSGIDDAGNRLRLVEELRDAVEGGGFVLHYQPQVDLHSGEVSAVEALLRWPHPRLGVVPPLDFLPLAEEAGLMRPLTAWVLDQALAQCARWRSAGRELAVSVNVSATNLLDAGFSDVVRELLTRHRVPPSALILEITETTIIGDFDRCKAVIGHLREIGLDVSIDDFGAGFTSLAYLGSLAVTELKLDRTFITGLATDERGRDLALIRATIELGHALGLRVVAEGVEEGATLDVLTHIGCDLAQGYFISRPMAASDLSLQPDLESPAQSVGGLRAS